MTETSSLFITNSFPHPPSVAGLPPSASPLPNGHHPGVNQSEEEEYTIKCICRYSDDDGNTVYCEKCDTWQHIECYYHSKDIPEEHFCADCNSSQKRELDPKKARDRQRRAREQLEAGDQKIKRPSSKSTKKKQKEPNVQETTNGWISHDRNDSLSNNRDQPPPAKKPKTSHRTSTSVASLNGESRKRAHSNVQSYPSPSKSPQDVYRFPLIPQYTTQFLELYDHDGGDSGAAGNEYTISAINHLSRWKTDPGLLVNGMNQQPSIQAPFVFTQQDMDIIPWPKISLDLNKATEIDCDGRHPTWKFLRLQQQVSKDTMVGEVRGQVGMLEEYCQQHSSQNRWSELAHPDPFVFFHPHMNIYIDSRAKGTQLRFLRRSCQPNVTLKTFVSDGTGDPRHCFVANQDIPAGSELTAAWFINPSMFDNNTDREDLEQIESQRCEWVSRVLANFGDCACGHTQCLLGRFDRRSSIKSIDGISKPPSGRKRKAKGKQAISPLSTGQATNSRAGSETINGQNEDDQEDRRSTSGSSRSGVRSRDHTPNTVAVLDADPILGNGLTARELKKIKAAEQAYNKRTEQVASGSKKKKRISGGSTLKTPSLNGSKQTGSSPVEADVKQFSASPPPPSVEVVGNAAKHAQTTQARRPLYTSVGVQTDLDEAMQEPRPMKRFRYITPMQRLLKKIKQDRDRYLLLQQQQKQEEQKRPQNSARIYTASESDVEMKDASSATVSCNSSMSVKMTSSNSMPAYPLPSQAAHTQTGFKTPLAPRLHLSTLPPVPTFTDGTVLTPGSSASTPSLTTSISNQSPQPLSLQLGSLVPSTNSMITPSPIKKKLSLGDYMSRRNQATTPATEKSQAQAFGDSPSERDLYGSRKLSTTSSEISIDNTTTKPTNLSLDGMMKLEDVDESAIEDSEVKDEEEPEYSPPGASPVHELAPSGNALGFSTTSATTISSPSSLAPDVANALAQIAQFQQRADKARSQSTNSAL